MLRKLLKYDLLANIRIYLLIIPAIIVFALLERLMLSANLSGRAADVLTATTTTIYVLAVVAACIFSLIVSITRFYSGLLRDEGYLMFTLPVKPWQLIFSKFLVSTLTFTLTLAVSIASTAFLFDGIDGFYYVAGLLWSYLDLPTGITLVLSLLIAFFSICMAFLQIYLSCAVGHLFRKHRVLWSFLTYYGINILIEILSVSSLLNLSATAFSTTGEVNFFLLSILTLQIAIGAVFFFGCERILRTKLNLE